MPIRFPPLRRGIEERSIRRRVWGRDSAREAYDAARLAGCGPEALILDAACGNGRHALPLARAGFRVVALDRSRPLLAAARRAACRASCHTDPRSRADPRAGWPRFVRGSYTKLPVEPGVFDAALCLGTALGYVDKEVDEAALREFRRVLAPHGRLVIETLHRGAIGDGLSEHEERPLESGETLCLDRSFDWERSVMYESQRLVGGSEAPDGFRAAPGSYELRVYSIDELTRMLEGAGFTVIGRYASLSGEGEPSPGTPLVLVGEVSN